MRRAKTGRLSCRSVIVLQLTELICMTVLLRCALPPRGWPIVRFPWVGRPLSSGGCDGFGSICVIRGRVRSDRAMSVSSDTDSDKSWEPSRASSPHRSCPGKTQMPYVGKDITVAMQCVFLPSSCQSSSSRLPQEILSRAGIPVALDE
jgi:hypothetical protein